MKNFSDEKAHILIVEDDTSSLNILEKLLKKEGYAVSVATDGEQALAIAREILPDLVVSDVMMPKMDGFTLCQCLRADKALASVPVILLTALNDACSRLRGLEMGADDFISKPFQLGELRARIRTIVNLNRYRRLLSERGKFEWVVEKSDDAYLILNKDCLISYANHRARQYLSLNEEPEKPEKFPKDVCTHYRCEPQNAWENWPIQQENVNYYLLQAETKQHLAFWLQVELHQLPMAEGFLIRLKNVSEQISLEQHVYTFQMLVSHKLRTPLAAFSALSIIKEKLQNHVSSELNSLIDMMCENGQRLQQQLIEILDYIAAPSLLKQTGGYLLKKFPILIENINHHLACQATLELPIHLEQHCLNISELALHSVLENIIGNAKKFHPEQQPNIDISVIEKDDKTLRINIRDDGQHLSPKDLERVWQPYYQSEKNITGEIGGMGIGLSIVATLIWGAGGQVAIQNRADKAGIIVSISLPVY